jgi:hypothetical protein
MSPTSLNTPQGQPSPARLEPFLRVRISNMERNRKDLLIRFDATVRPSGLPIGLPTCPSLTVPSTGGSELTLLAPFVSRPTCPTSEPSCTRTSRGATSSSDCLQISSRSGIRRVSRKQMARQRCRTCVRSSPGLLAMTSCSDRVGASPAAELSHHRRRRSVRVLPCCKDVLADSLPRQMTVSSASPSNDGSPGSRAILCSFRTRKSAPSSSLTLA